MNEQNKRRIWAEVSLKTLEENYKAICEHVGGRPVMPVIKADGYGHGAIPVAKRLAALKPPFFAVATVEEALEMRENGIETPILILGYVADEDVAALIGARVTVTVSDRESAEGLSKAAVAAGGRIDCHFAVETGMGRLGVSAYDPEAAIEELFALASLPGLHVSGIFTHFAVADTSSGMEYTLEQRRRFRTVCEGLEQAGLELRWKHCTNSAGLTAYDDPYYDLDRAGIVLYGYLPDPAFVTELRVKPAMTLKARVAQVRTIRKGQSISYGRTYTADRDLRVAVVAAGYADGWLRSGSGWASVVIGGRVCPVRGRICMDMCMAELPDDLEVHRGDEVILFGPGPRTAEDAATAAGTISYEMLCAVSRRVRRVYID